MAVWQVRGWMVPRRALAGKRALAIARAIRTGTPNLWRGLDGGWLGDAKELPLPCSAPDPETRLWGDRESHYLLEATEGHGLTEVELGIDLRQVEPEFVRKLCELLVRLDARLVLPNGSVLPSSAPKLMTELAESPAAHFVTNPRGFLRSLSPRSRVPRS